jgi:hypothetical protein
MRFLFRWLRSVLAGLRRIGARGATRRQRAVFGLTTIVLAGAMALFVAAALGAANPLGDPSGFEANDGNMTVEGTATLDWNCLTSLAVTNSAGTCGTPNTSYAHEQDLSAGTSSDITWPSGSKLDASCPVLAAGTAPSKDSFTDISSYAGFGANAGAGGRVDTYLYGATIRQTANGSASENVVLQQGTLNGVKETPCAGEPAGATIYRHELQMSPVLV